VRPHLATPLSSRCKFWPGLVGKHRERAYRAGRSPHWIKVKNRAHASLTREF
jgi:ATP-dependent DNA ligase